MLASDYETLPDPMRDEVRRFFDSNESWLVDVLERGREEGSLRDGTPPREVAQAIVGGLEGALLVARPYGDVKRFQTAAGQLLDALASTPRS